MFERSRWMSVNVLLLRLGGGCCVNACVLAVESEVWKLLEML
jgi:hypothetical protein